MTTHVSTAICGRIFLPRSSENGRCYTLRIKNLLLLLALYSDQH